MSAWIVTPEHIDLILTEMISIGELSESDRVDEIGQMLLDENRASVDFRYSETNESVEYAFHEFPLDYNRHDVDMAMRSYRYQSCEHEAWDGSMSRALIEGWIVVNRQRFESIDVQAAHDDDDRGWAVGPKHIWDSEREMYLPDYRAACREMPDGWKLIAVGPYSSEGFSVLFREIDQGAHLSGEGTSYEAAFADALENAKAYETSSVDDMTEHAIASAHRALLSDRAVTALLEAVERDSVLVMALSVRKMRGDKIATQPAIEIGREWVESMLAATDND